MHFTVFMCSSETLKSVFSRRRVRNSSSARNKRSNTSQIANAIESARSFDPVIISRCSSSAGQSSDQVSYRYDDFDMQPTSIKKPIKL